MSSSTARTILYAPLLLACVSSVSSILTTDGDGHLLDQGCETCHLGADNVSPENAHQLIASQEKLCSVCHEDAIAVSHPSGFSPTRSLPPEYPVDWKLDLTCSTCHLVHGNNEGLMRVPLLGKELCLSCHDEGFFQDMADHGQSLVLSGHLDGQPPIGSQLLDNYSLQCLECHIDKDGRTGVEVSQGIVRHQSGSANHPIGANYAKALAYGGYRQLDPDTILLPDGLVSCVSCHRAYSQEHGALKKLAEKAELCFGCHDI